MAVVRSHQDAVFNRTGRVEIPASHIKRDVGVHQIEFRGLHVGSWKESLTDEVLSESVLYLDIQSLLMSKRTTVQDTSAVFDANWPGVVVEVPRELTNGDYRVKLQVTIALPENHSDAGRMLARSSELVIVEGPETGKGQGLSLLKVSPSADEITDLSELKITDAGPILYVNTRIPNVSWRDLASDPKFKFTIFSNCVREVLRHLVIHPDSRTGWGAAWLALDGIKGLDLPDVSDLGVHDAWREAHDYAETACEHLLEQVELTRRFADAIGRGGA